MKTFNNLYQQVISVENILAAIDEAADGKRHLASVKKVLRNKEKYALKLHKQLKDGSWTPPTLHNAREINDGIQLKKRLIVCPEFLREQVVHHALFRVIGPICQKKFYEHSCGSIPHKGDADFLKYLKKKLPEMVSTGRPIYYAKLDIKKFFNTLKPYIVFKHFRGIISDKECCLLMSKILRKNAIIYKRTVIKCGCPIGFFTSPWCGNITLTELDHLIMNKLRVKIYCRFIDDMLLLDYDKEHLKEICFYIEEYLGRELHLQLKRKFQVHLFTNNNPIEFVGYKYFPTKTILRDVMFLRAKRAISRMGKKNKITVYDCQKLLCYNARFNNADMQYAAYKYISLCFNLMKCRKQIGRKARLQNAMAKKRIQQPA